jgi:hypothetical protein
MPRNAVAASLQQAQEKGKIKKGALRDYIVH